MRKLPIRRHRAETAQARLDATIRVRQENVAVRADLNACVVLINLVWSAAWDDEGRFSRAGWSRPLLRELVARVSGLQRLAGARTPKLDDLKPVSKAEGLIEGLDQGNNPFNLRPAIKAAELGALKAKETKVVEITAADPPVKALLADLVPAITLLSIGVNELLLAVHAREPGVVEAQIRMHDQLLNAFAIGHGSALEYQAACIYARRYVLLLAPDALRRDWPLLREQASEARRLALACLAHGVSGSPLHKAWASSDPAFRHLLDEKDFAFLLATPGEAQRIDFRAPFTDT